MFGKNRNLRKRSILIAILFVVPLVGFLPVTDRLSYSENVVLESKDLEIPAKLGIYWWDFRLNRKRFSQTVVLDPEGRATVPDCRIPTRLWRLGLKKVLSRFELWTSCEHCDGPWVDCSLRLTREFEVPENMRLVQNSEVRGKTLFLKAMLIPNESKFESREFKVRDYPALLEEARRLIANGTAAHIPPSAWTPELQSINPVRVECRNAALILWMGGTLGYAIVPDSDSFPAMNLTWVSGSGFRHIAKLERMSLNGGSRPARQTSIVPAGPN